MRKLNWKSDWFVGLMITLMFLIFAETQLFESLDNRAYNLGVSFSSDKEASEDIVIIAIDDKSLQALGAWPWSRDVLAKITRLLGKYRPRVFGFTMPFDMAQNQASLASVKNLRKTLKKELKLSPGVNKALKKTEMTLNSDETLAASFDSAGRIVLAIPYIAANEPIADESKPLPAYMQKFILRNVTARDDTSGMEWLWPNPNITRAGALFPPIEVLARQAEGVGVVNFNDSISREPLIVGYGQDFLPSFPLMLVTRSKGISMKHIVSRRGAKPMLGGKELDADIDFNIYPRFYEDENGESPFKIYSLIDVLDGTVSASLFRDKIVLIGLTSPRLARPRLTPNGHSISVTLATAHSVSSLLNRELYRLPDWAGWARRAIIIVIGLYLMFALGRFRIITGLFVSLFLLLMIFNAHFVLISLKSIWLPMMAAAVLLVLGHLVLGARHYVNARLLQAQGQLSDANKELGQSLHAQGRLDQAFEKFCHCHQDKSVYRQLYNLGLDYERKRQFNKAASVFKHIRDHDENYNDVVDRIQQNETAANTVVLGSSSSTNTNTTFITSGKGLEKPKLGRYIIDSELGRGAMGVVYLGHDEKIGRTVAIKTLAISDQIEESNREDVKARFFREAEAAGRLDHPCIVTVYDVGEEQDLAYIAMDYIKGKDLSAYTSEETLLPLTRVFKVIMSVALALDYAHQKHVVHRDIKPANIIYDEASNTSKLTDFGVACLTDASKTKTGTVIGSPVYMSPEQLIGKDIDGRADIFSLGVTFYQLLTGELPFRGDSMASLMYNIANEKHADVRS
ncbi:MAG: serine/threonine-protein kinase, partial [Gammaproteobacteria bacterium]|nr:serine/threonine-protein kinase [Gammaproteobacteria bacterium]